MPRTQTPSSSGTFGRSSRIRSIFGAATCLVVLVAHVTTVAAWDGLRVGIADHIDLKESETNGVGTVVADHDGPDTDGISIDTHNSAVRYNHMQTTTTAIHDADGDDETGNERRQRNSNVARPIRVACVGDSITLRGCVPNENQTYSGHLQRILGPDFAVTNYGNSAKTLLKGGVCFDGSKNVTQRCSYWDTDEFAAAQDADPDIVTIMLGTNDAKRHNWYNGTANGLPIGGGTGYFRDYLEMVKIFWELPSLPTVFLVIPPPLVPPPNHPTDPVAFDMDPYVANTELRDIIPTVAVESVHRLHSPVSRIGVVDAWSALGGTKGYNTTERTCDGVHPEEPAHELIAEAIAKAIAGETIAALRRAAVVRS